MSENDLNYQLKPVRIRSESGTEDVHYPVLYDGLPEEAKLCAELELNETEENKANGIRKLKEYMKRENLTCPDGRILVTVLRNCKYNFKKSEKKLKRFLKLRQFTSQRLAQMDMNTISRLLEEFMFVGLPYRDKHGRVIIYTRPNLNMDKYSHEDILTCAVVYLLFILSFPMSSILGVTHLAECSTPHLHIFYPILKIMKMFTTSLVALHGSGFDSIHKVFHPDILPYEIGGTLGPLSIKHYKEELLCFIEGLKDENSSKNM